MEHLRRSAESNSGSVPLALLLSNSANITSRTSGAPLQAPPTMGAWQQQARKDIFIYRISVLFFRGYASW